MNTAIDDDGDVTDYDVDDNNDDEGDDEGDDDYDGYKMSAQSNW